jgi:hypothetical protein
MKVWSNILLQALICCLNADDKGKANVSRTKEAYKKRGGEKKGQG